MTKIRGIIRDILSIYLGYEILRGAIFGDFTLSSTVLIAAALLFAMAVWFILEKIGIIPKITG